MSFMRLKRSFTGFSDAKFIDFCSGVIQGLTDNPNFPNIADSLAVFEKSFDKYVTSIPARNVRNMVNTAVKNEYRKEANLECLILASLVEFESRLNEAVLRSSNFETVSKPQPKGMVGLVKGLELGTNGIDQMMVVQCDTDNNATLYNVRISTDELNWNWFGASTSRSVKVTGLPNATKLFVQMRLENSHGHSPWSTSKVAMIGMPEVVQSIHE